MQWRVLGAETLCMHSVEGPKGELVVTMAISSTRTWRCRIRPADLGHILSLQARDGDLPSRYQMESIPSTESSECQYLVSGT